MADHRIKYQFIWWLRLQFWFVRDEKPLGFIYLWRMHIGPLEVRRWNHTPLQGVGKKLSPPHESFCFLLFRTGVSKLCRMQTGSLKGHLNDQPQHYR
jgi:hypothetical protein